MLTSKLRQYLLIDVISLLTLVVILLFFFFIFVYKVIERGVRSNEVSCVTGISGVTAPAAHRAALIAGQKVVFHLVKGINPIIKINAGEVRVALQACKGRLLRRTGSKP